MEQLKNYKKVNGVMHDLKQDCMKPKHWNDLLAKLRLKVKKDDLYLEDLWCADLLGRSKLINDVMSTARGEAIIENFLTTIKDSWTEAELEMVWYQKKCKLIKGWDDLFAQIDDHLGQITSMKMSPYYRIFEKDIE